MRTLIVSSRPHQSSAVIAIAKPLIRSISQEFGPLATPEFPLNSDVVVALMAADVVFEALLEPESLLADEGGGASVAAGVVDRFGLELEGGVDSADAGVGSALVASGVVLTGGVVAAGGVGSTAGGVDSTAGEGVLAAGEGVSTAGAGLAAGVV